MARNTDTTPASRVIQMAQDTDPRKVIWDLVGEKCPVEVCGPQVMVATYVRPEKTASGLYLTANSRREDEYQGKVGMVIALGPTAFKESGTVDFGGVTAKIGDWVIYSPHDGLAMNINKAHCRLIDDVQVRGIVSRPDILL